MHGALQLDFSGMREGKSEGQAVFFEPVKHVSVRSECSVQRKCLGRFFNRERADGFTQLS